MREKGRQCIPPHVAVSTKLVEGCNDLLDVLVPGPGISLEDRASLRRRMMREALYQLFYFYLRPDQTPS